MLMEQAYAKINLTLDVNYKRPDGYHDIDMVMQTIDLSDSIWIEEIDGDSIIIESNATYLPLDSSNLAYQAAEEFQREMGIRRGGLRIRIDKNIPVAAGLGGGSSDAAAVLRGLNRLWECRATLHELEPIAARIGSDVAFLLHRGCAVATSRGERVQKVKHPMKAWAVLIRPNVFVSTRTVYEAMHGYIKRPHPSSTTMVTNLQKGDFEGVLGSFSNDLMPIAEHLYPEISELRGRIENVVKAPVFMSGSGPTLFCLAPNQLVAQRYYNAIRGFIRDVYLVRFVF